MENLIKERFVQQTLEYQGNRLLRNQGNILYKKLKFRSGRLESGRSISVSGGDDISGKLSFRHTGHERFLDMKRSVTNKKGKQVSRAGFKIHNRFIYGCYFAIARQLSTGFTDEIRQQIHDELKSEING